jgi:hypothetical protein
LNGAESGSPVGFFAAIRLHPPNFASSKVRIFPLVTERSSALAAYGDGSPPAAAISATFRRTSSVVNAGRRSYRPSAQRYSIERFLAFDIPAFSQSLAERINESAEARS